MAGGMQKTEAAQKAGCAPKLNVKAVTVPVQGADGDGVLGHIGDLRTTGMHGR